MDSIELYKKAQEIKRNISSIKEITKNMLNDVNGVEKNLIEKNY